MQKAVVKLFPSSALLPASDRESSILLNNLHRYHPLNASLHNLPPPLSAYPRQLTSERVQPEPFLPLGV